MRINLTTRLVIKILMIGCSLLGLNGKANSQSLFSDINAIPPSPNATQFNKFIDQPVSLYTGLPSISVPIYQLNLPQLQLPISINYHASGLKVGEHASWVGAGWSLNAGGSINRVVKGLPDEFDTGAKFGFFHLDQVDSALTMPNGRGVAYSEIWDCITQIHATPPEGPFDLQDFFAQGHYDMEPDLYHFSFPGGGGKFVFSQDREVIRYQYDDIEITEHPFQATPVVDHTGTNEFTWKIQDATGVIYTYQAQERTYTNSVCGTSVSSFYDSPFWHRSGWQLVKMELEGNWIEFEYENELSITFSRHMGESGQYKVSGSGNQTNLSSCISTTTVEGKRISRIHSSNGYEILFDESITNRLDLAGSKSLSGIRVKKDGQLVKEFELSQSYFGTDEKLKLDSIKEVKGAEELPARTFEYYTGTFPAIDSRAQDYWGYHNGSTQSSMMPEYRDSSYHVNRTSTVSRNPSFGPTLTGTLKKQVLPTGGSIQYTYELNRAKVPGDPQWYSKSASATNQVSQTNFYVAEDAHVTITPDGLVNEVTQDGISEVEFRSCTDGTYGNCTQAVLTAQGNRYVLPQGYYQVHAESPNTIITRSMEVEYEQKITSLSKEIGGLRVKRIDFYETDTQKSLSKVYNYEEGGESTGLLFTEPYLGGYITSYTAGSVVGSTCGDDSGGPGFYLNISSSVSVPMSTFEGSHLGYSKVFEYQIDPTTLVQYPISVLDQKQGAKVYEFINEKPEEAVYPYVPPTDLSYKNGKPLVEEVYKSIPRDTTVQGQFTLAFALEKVQAKTYHYASVEAVGLKSVLGINFKKVHTSYCYSCDLATLADKHLSNTYEIETKWYKLLSDTTKLYSGGNLLSTVTNYTYNAAPAHSMVQTISRIGSRGEVKLDSLYRDSSHPALVTRQEMFTDGVITHGEELTYHGRLPAVSKRLNLGSSNYELLRSVSYDTASRVTGVQNFPTVTAPGIESSYIWGYDQAYPIIECNDISHADLKTAVSNAIINLPPPHALNGIEDLDALLDLVFNTGSPNWTLWRTFNTELRAELGDRIFKTYTYQDGIGMSSVTDANGISQYFEYDTFNRLIRVKDNDEKLVREVTYNYKSN